MMHPIWVRWVRERQETGCEGWRWGVPRRWLPDLLRLHWYGLLNIIRWAPVIYRDADFDHDYLLGILEYKLRRMAHHHRTYGVSADRDRIARQLSMAARLCRRLSDDGYFRKAGYDPATWPSLSHDQRVQIIEKETQLQRQDLALLSELLREHLLSWWD